MRLTGNERKELRAILQEAFSRQDLVRALSESELSLDWEDIIHKGSFEDELHEFLKLAPLRGWLPTVVRLLAEHAPGREDLIARARAILAAGESRRFAFEPGRPVVWVPALAAGLLLGVALWYFWPRPVPNGGGGEDDPNFFVTVQQGAPPAPVTGQKVYVGKASSSGTAEDPQTRVTNSTGQAFFRLPLGPDRIYLGGVELQQEGGRKECQFPAFLVTASRSITHNLNDLKCLEQSADNTADSRLLRTATSRNTASLNPSALTGQWANWQQRVPRIQSVRPRRAPFGVPEAPIVLDRASYSLGFDPEVRTAVWVSYTVHAVNNHQIPRRAAAFRWDPAIPSEFQCDPRDYAGNPYDRGHLIPRRDVVLTASSRESAVEAEREVHYYSLVVPQPDKTNQLTWKAVEDLVTEASQRLGPIHVLAGPVYPRGGNLPFLVIGPGKTPVPTGLFRVLLRQTRGGTWKSIGFLVPNDGSVERDARKFAASVAEVEAQTGLVFFSGMDAASARRLKQSKDLSAFLADN